MTLPISSRAIFWLVWSLTKLYFSRANTKLLEKHSKNIATSFQDPNPLPETGPVSLATDRGTTPARTSRPLSDCLRPRLWLVLHPAGQCPARPIRSRRWDRVQRHEERQLESGHHLGLCGNARACPPRQRCRLANQPTSPPTKQRTNALEISGKKRDG